MRKSKKMKDKRVTVKYTRPLLWVILILVYDALFVGFSLLVDEVWDLPVSMGIVYAIIGSYIFTASGLSVLAVWFVLDRFVNRHINTLKQAAQTVASGDYSVRIHPHGRNGKKDEFQVLFDDFNVMAETLEGTEMMKKDFISNISHELKTPLAAIQNFSTMLQIDGLTEADRKEFARNISESTERLTDLVTNILQLSSLEKQAIVIDKQRYNLSEQLNQCIIGFELIWDTKNIEIVTNCDESIFIDNDRQLLDIVFNNLLSNAFKFTENGGTVEIASVKTKKGVSVSIKDTGCGMNESQIRHIFEKFYQADVSHSTKGNGLGLALVKKICELLGATITVDSTPKKGSVFTVFLPC